MAEVAGSISARGTYDHASALLTFLLADIRGYTRFSAEHGDHAAAALSELFLILRREVVSSHGGDVFGSAGDQALAAFTSTHAALYAALELQSRLEDEQVAHPDLPLMAGIGLDTGEAIKIGHDYRGNAINLAARLCSLAGGGETFATETVITVARKVEGLAVVDRGEVTLKGLARPVRVVQVAPEGSLPDSLPPLQLHLMTHPTNLPDEPTPFIGRAGEIAQITALLGQSGVRLVTLLGPGGTGKTRLALQAGMNTLYSFRDGVFFCDLSPLADSTLVVSTIAETLEADGHVAGCLVPVSLLADATDHLTKLTPAPRVRLFGVAPYQFQHPHHRQFLVQPVVDLISVRVHLRAALPSRWRSVQRLP
jgi:class 3 adenylate cyclase